MSICRRTKPETAAPPAPKDLTPIVRLWLLRLLGPLDAHSVVLGKEGIASDELAQALGLGRWVAAPHEYDRKAALLALRKAHAAAEKQQGAAAAPACLARNVQRLAELTGLAEAGCRLLEFFALLHTEPLLAEAVNAMGELTTRETFRVLAKALGLAEADVRRQLNPQGMLIRSGLVKLERRLTYSMSDKIELLSGNFADTLCTFDADPLDLLRDTIMPCAAPQLALDDFTHVAEPLAIACAYLKRAAASGRRGVNLFLHGLPGTGKSELARVLAHEMGCALFEVACENDDGDAVSGERRLRAFRAAQCLMGQRRVMMLFDEAEDVFNGGEHLFGKSTAQLHKAWINRSLEENPVPTLWLSNSVHSLDPAFVRRFDMVLHLPVPPRKQRERILDEACQGLLDAPGMKRIAQLDTVAPAVVTRAAAVVRLIRDELGAERSSAALELLIGKTLEAQGHRPLCKNSPDQLPDVYDPAFIHADADLSAVACGLAAAKSGRLCFYGPPGTGKTAYARWLAEQLDVPPVIKRASDIMSMWVGGSEKNIAGIFRAAEADGALLLIDEVDSFLQDRRGAKQSWEVSQVNEMLTQMESFAGVFIASTNLMDGLDQAALRRFDLKVKFDFMRPQQAWALLRHHCETLHLPAPGAADEARLMRLRQLTPGDFAAVLRRHRFNPLTSPAQLVSALESECALKEGARAPMGFVQ